MIQSTASKLHWNYFVALERDLEVVSRYIEFSQQNFEVYSIELAHLLFAAASEVDVVAKLVCQQVSPTARRKNIDDYRGILTQAIPDLHVMNVFVPRYGLVLTPWDSWSGQTNPLWWKSYNNVKHERDAHYSEATLKNALNSLGALLILTFHYYHQALPSGAGSLHSRKKTTLELLPESSLLRLPEDYYYDTLIV